MTEVECSQGIGRRDGELEIEEDFDAVALGLGQFEYVDTSERMRHPIC